MEDGDSEQLTLDNLRKRFAKNVVYVCFFHFQFAMQCIFIDFFFIFKLDLDRQTSACGKSI